MDRPGRAILGQWLHRLLTALLLLAGSFLLFLVQPLYGKLLLPWFGGSAAVWTACLLFFQTALLLGYLYSHWLVHGLQPRTRALVHIGLLLLAALLPITPVRPSSLDQPISQILLLLAASIGLPYLLLSATSPLLQAGWAEREQSAPYGLFALSNLGSLAGLLSYPFLVEPRLLLSQQQALWKAGFLAYAVLMVVPLWLSLREQRISSPTMRGLGERPTRQQAGLWLLLSLCGTLLLAAITTHMCQNVAPVPLLWVLPLAAYLLSFILAFAPYPFYSRQYFRMLLPVALLWLAFGAVQYGGRTSLSLAVPLFVGGLFVCCLFLHGELALRKPAAGHLTWFYLILAAGGALGTLLASVAAPALLSSDLELPLSLALCAVFGAAFLFGFSRPRLLLRLATVGLLAFLVASRFRDQSNGVRDRARNFYGTLTLLESAGFGSGPTRTLVHGAIEHGTQWLLPGRNTVPLTYYSENSGIGQLLQQPSGKPRRVGIVGLGTGSLAAYGNKGDVYRFYELNPQVAEMARRYFTYLSQSEAQCEVVLGDARISLEREAPQQYDVLVVDAFSGDAVPVHLLTKEAVQLYFRHLKPDGVLALHLTNRYLDLPAAAGNVLSSLYLPARLIPGASDGNKNIYFTLWGLAARQESVLRRLPSLPLAQPMPTRPDQRPWTDQYSNLIAFFR